MKKSLSILHALSYGFRTFFNNFSFIILAQIILLGGKVLVENLVRLVFFFDLAADVSKESINVQLRSGAHYFLWPKIVIFYSIVFVLFAWYTLNWTNLILKIKDTGKARINDIKIMPTGILSYLGMCFTLFLLALCAILLLTLFVYLIRGVLGVIIAVACGIYLLPHFMFTNYLFVDGDSTILGPIQKNIKMVRGKVGSLIGAGILLIILGIILVMLGSVAGNYCLRFNTPLATINCLDVMELALALAMWTLGVLYAFVWVHMYRQIKPKKG